MQSENPQVLQTTEQIEMLKRQNPNVGVDDFAIFVQTCQRLGLDPFSRQIYLIVRGGKPTTQVSIDGLRLVAHRTGEYLGQTEEQWCGPDGEWRGAWLESTPPAAARIGVYRKGNASPTYAVATFAEYAQGANGRPSGMWAKMPARMLLKCAEAIALRKAFPAELSGVYTEDEMAQAGGVAFLTNTQRKELVAMAQLAGFSPDDARRELLDAIGVANTFEIPADRFNEALGVFESFVNTKTEATDEVAA